MVSPLRVAAQGFELPLLVALRLWSFVPHNQQLEVPDLQLQILRLGSGEMPVGARKNLLEIVCEAGPLSRVWPGAVQALHCVPRELRLMPSSLL